jgi:uncharacterized protein YndB with AHSA1/START domain
MSKTINHTLFYAHPPEIVWEYLTKPELIEQWLMKNDFQPVVGHEFRFHTRPLPQFDFDGIVYCKVLEVVPQKKLVYSWKGGPAPGRITMDSVVKWTLLAKNNGTELLLEHSGIIENVGIYEAMNEGWLKNIKRIDELINTALHGTTRS